VLVLRLFALKLLEDPADLRVLGQNSHRFVLALRRALLFDRELEGFEELF